jgi:hypothetical protein
MTTWQRVKSAAGWGLFLGLCDWVLASGIVRKMPTDAVWAVVFAQTLLGTVVGIEKWKAAWWVKGLVLGLAFNVPLALGLYFFRPDWGRPLLLPLLVSGIVIGLVVERMMGRKR